MGYVLLIWDIGYRYGHQPYRYDHPGCRYGIWAHDMGDDSIDMVISHIEYGISCHSAAGVPLVLGEFVGYVERLAWPRQTGARGLHRRANSATHGGRVEIVRWAREHDCPWGSQWRTTDSGGACPISIRDIVSLRLG
jgi:hypothetical protein